MVRFIFWPEAEFLFDELLWSNDEEEDEVGPEAGLGVW